MLSTGFADLEKQERVQPTSMFRIASISKPVTAVAVPCPSLLTRNSIEFT
jgi:CubicO group peptidase (beta-lactamase class C family)